MLGPHELWWSVTQSNQEQLKEWAQTMIVDESQGSYQKVKGKETQGYGTDLTTMWEKTRGKEPQLDSRAP